MRASLGPHTTFDDLDRLVALISSMASNQLSSPSPSPSSQLTPPIPYSIESLTIYPIKSCAGFRVTGSWALQSTGLFLDREWAIVDDLGTHLALKRFASLIRIKPTPDLKAGTLMIDFPGKDPLVLSLKADLFSSSEAVLPEEEELIICGEAVRGRAYLSQVNEWFQGSLGLDGIRLVRAAQTRASKAHSTTTEKADSTSILLANEGQLLIIGTASIEDLSRRLGSPVSDSQFRPNLLIRTTTPYEEDSWKSFRIGDQVFTSIGPCSRCNTICLDDETLTFGPEPLQTLTTYRRAKGGRVLFGALFDHVPSQSRPPFVLDTNSSVLVEIVH